jgi:putative transposase
MRILKANSSRWLREQLKNRGAFAWQTGYSAFTVSHSNLERVEQYIATQEEHHRKMSFQDEVRALLRKHGIVFDEQYLWD